MTLIITSSCNVNSQNNFTPDSTINNLLILHDEESSYSFYSDIDNIKFIDGYISFLNREVSPMAIFLNTKKNEYLIVFEHEGDSHNSFSEFEIGYTNDVILNEVCIKTDYKEFYTESGIRLGLTLEELVKIKGKAYQHKGNIIIYHLFYNNSKFLQVHNMPEYILQCEINNNKITKIHFGFIFP